MTKSTKGKGQLSAMPKQKYRAALIRVGDNSSGKTKSATNPQKMMGK